MIGEGGKLLGMDGEVRRGPDGQPLRVSTKGRAYVSPYEEADVWVIGDDRKVIKPDGKTVRGYDGRPLKAKHDEDMVFGPGGEAFLVNADGRVRDFLTGKMVDGVDGGWGMGWWRPGCQN